MAVVVQLMFNRSQSRSVLCSIDICTVRLHATGNVVAALVGGCQLHGSLYRPVRWPHATVCHIPAECML